MNSASTNMDQPEPVPTTSPLAAAGGTTPMEGGAAAWSPNITPSVGVDLTPAQELACAFRILAADGFSENIAGHITVRDGTSDNFLVNPWGLWWEEIRASDICTVSPDGDVVRGRWDVTPAIHIHTELHRARPEADVVIHNHPYHVTVLASLGLLPDLFNQTACMFEGDLSFVDEYTGEIASADLGADLAARIGSATVIVLANHGVIVTAPTIKEATYRAAAIDRQCRLTYDVLMAAAVTGRTATTVALPLRAPMKRSLLERAADVFWDGWVRKLVREQHDVLL